ncbi:phosphoketolase [Mycoplasma miroungirhinis]|uniref:Phosphoketolase family protein n=1 Tax=Mycoplasma miroungirhinis TaxID=754516 RepID=A0A6M4JI66_9MOLU|nr:phosphoketolase family protein [Mycoplasma miroungirhinis]QJR44151.1 phosphoketolase family protein [Mycoplasma miroungirhinis]
MSNNNFSTKEYFLKMDAWFRAANYLSVGQIYLRDNPLLLRPLQANDIKIYPIGHWGTIPGQNFIYVHLNRVINKYNLDMFYIEGPGHGGQVMISNAYLDGSYSQIYKNASEDINGLKYLFKNFSFPGGTASHAAPETPGSIHEGGELGYALAHATGAILDNPNLIAATVIGDGEAETGPLAASWFSNTFINPVNDGAILPILYLNGGKISNPTILSRKSDKELKMYFKGLGWDPIFVKGNDSLKLHPIMAKKMDQAIEKILNIQKEARKYPANQAKRPNWPVIIARLPKGWTGPKTYNNETLEGSFRSHQVPIPVNANNTEKIADLENWLRSYRPEELFTSDGKFKEEFKIIAPSDDKKMSIHKVTNGGINPKLLNLPDWTKYALNITTPSEIQAQDMVELGKYFTEIIKLNPNNFRIFGPDETKSNRLTKTFEITSRQWLDTIDQDLDEFMSPAGRIIDSQLSEHQAEGFLEAYVLTGRHGIFASYESFLRVVDSMITQHQKWIKQASKLQWRNDYPSLNIMATSTAFQQDHNGYTHQDPGILGHLADKDARYIREYLPADTNSLLAVMDKSFKQRNVINLIVASKQPRQQFFNQNEAQELVDKGLKVIDWASTSKNNEVDLVMVSSGTEPTIEALASITYLHKKYPELKIKYVNVVDLLKLRHPSIDPRGLSDAEFDEIFTKDKPIVFAFHGYEGLLRDIFFTRHNHNLFIHGYRENGDITTSFDIRVMSQMDRFNISKTAANAVYGNKANDFIEEMDKKLSEHKQFIRENGTDLDEVKNWKFQL